jgi:Cation transporting ATPase, C-terminus
MSRRPPPRRRSRPRGYQAHGTSGGCGRRVRTPPCRGPCHFLLAAKTGEVLTFVLANALGLGAPPTITQILLMNLLTDELPALALGGDPAGAEAMRVPPRPLKQSPLAPIWRGVLLGGAAPAPQRSLHT